MIINNKIDILPHADLLLFMVPWRGKQVEKSLTTQRRVKTGKRRLLLCTIERNGKILFPNISFLVSWRGKHLEKYLTTQMRVKKEKKKAFAL